MKKLYNLIDSVNPYIILATSICLEVVGASCMKLSDGFSILHFTVIVAFCYVISLGGLIFVLKHLPLGITYGIWGGVGTAATALVGILAWGDPFTILTCLGLVLIIGGIVLLNSSEK